MPLVKYDGDNLHTLSGTRGVSFRFLPGTNEVPADIWDNIKEHSDSAKDMLELGKLKEISAPKLEPKGEGKTLKKVGAEAPKPADTLDEVDIARVPTPAALELIAGIVTEAPLLRFQKQEKGRKAGARKHVLAKLEEQIKLANAPMGEPQAQPPGADPSKPNQSPSRVRKMLGMG